MTKEEAAHAACPFCGLGCDDLRLEKSGDALRVANADCPLARAGFGGDARGTPMIDGRPATLDAAVARAGEILAAARAPLVHGMAADLAGQRAAIALARRIGAAVDHLGGDALARNLAAVGDGGWITASLAEIRNRADLLVSFGDPAQAMPRFWPRVMWPDATLIADTPSPRDVVLLGEAIDPRAGMAPDGRAAEIVAMPRDAMPQVAAALAALAREAKVFAEAVGGVPLAVLRRLVDRLRAARYAVIAWNAAAMDFPQADLTVATLAELLRALNKTTRAVGLPLGGTGNALGAQASALWLTGSAPRLRFVADEARHDASLWSAQRLIDAGEADALLWIDALTRRAPPPASRIPTIALARPGTHVATPPAVFIPLATPGLDHPGHVLRGDAIVALRLDKQRDTELPAVAEVVEKIASGLAHTSSPPSPRGRGIGGGGVAARLPQTKESKAARAEPPSPDPRPHPRDALRRRAGEGGQKKSGPAPC
ncbi:MAG: formylmethanofuran dehydrogenase subunit B [Alphaproteobacteria bacterium]|nr:formylmethanofuran dehydrogenase subunit B [Alphaproteobacteria bacterium]